MYVISNCQSLLERPRGELSLRASQVTSRCGRQDSHLLICRAGPLPRLHDVSRATHKQIIPGASTSVLQVCQADNAKAVEIHSGAYHFSTGGDFDRSHSCSPHWAPCESAGILRRGRHQQSAEWSAVRGLEPATTRLNRERSGRKLKLNARVGQVDHVGSSFKAYLQDSSAPWKMARCAQDPCEWHWTQERLHLRTERQLVNQVARCVSMLSVSYVPRPKSSGHRLR
mmetsp:Transcript_25954/g.45192  ORF Transcript_25954/g.45192 Transcript_25954/m.45192 type:complete len:227 (-) Transcript_25954:634-1314(-)